MTGPSQAPLNQELIELLRNVKQLLAWQTGLIHHALDRLVEQTGPMEHGPGTNRRQ
ncbi:MAG: hypothetical protein ACLFUJ_08720 [Phycisphaerae bacterium]